MKIACLGSAPSSISLAPYSDSSYSKFIAGKSEPKYPPAPHFDDEWDLWGCSPGLFGVAVRINRWFELHRWEPGQTWFSPEYCQFLRDFRGPVYTGGVIPEIQNHVVYPLNKVEAEFSAFFLTSSLSQMAALAILEIEQIRRARRAADPSMLPNGVSESELQKDDDDDVIGFWGVDMSSLEEYGRQKPGCWFFGLEAIRRGIGLYYPPESDLFCPEPPYGLCEWDHAYIKSTVRMKELNMRISNAQAQLQSLQAEMAATVGARDQLNYTIKNWQAEKFKLPPDMILRHLPGTGLGVSVEVDCSPHQSTGIPNSLNLT